MLTRVQELLDEVKDFSASTKEELETFRIRFLGKKGVMNDLFAAFKSFLYDHIAIVASFSLLTFYVF